MTGCENNNESKTRRLEYQKMYYSIPANKERRKEYIKKYVLAHPGRRLYSVVKARAKRKGIEFSLGIDDIHIPDVCPVLGIPLIVGAGSQSKGVTYKPNFATVDRINPKKGYTKDNIRVISFLANSMKRDATPDQLIDFATWVMREFSEVPHKNKNKGVTNE